MTLPEIIEHSKKVLQKIRNVNVFVEAQNEAQEKLIKDLVTLSYEAGKADRNTEIIDLVQGIREKYKELESDDYDNGCAETKKLILENLKFI